MKKIGYLFVLCFVVVSIMGNSSCSTENMADKQLKKKTDAIMEESVRQRSI